LYFLVINKYNVTNKHVQLLSMHTVVRKRRGKLQIKTIYRDKGNNQSRYKSFPSPEANQTRNIKPISNTHNLTWERKLDPEITQIQNHNN